MQHPLLVGDLRDRLRDAGVHVADQKAHLVALDELARLLNAGADVVRRVLDQQLDRAPQDAALGVDLLDCELGARHLVLCHRRVYAGERVDHADAHGGLAARGDNEWRGDLGEPERGGALEHLAPVIREGRRSHDFLPEVLFDFA